MNWKCRLGFHDWRHLETHYAPIRYSGDGPIRVIIGGVRFHFKECSRCPKWKQYYPWKEPPREDDIWDYPEQEKPEWAK